MAEQRKHQRVRFVRDPSVRIRQGGTGSTGALENLSLGGLQLRCATPLALQASACVELRLPGSGLLELSVRIVSRVGECYGARFIPGPLSEALLRLAIQQGLANGQAASLAVKELGGRRVMHVVGCLGSKLGADFQFALNAGVGEIDLSGVTAIDAAGIGLCRQAQQGGRASIVRPSACVRVALGEAESTFP